jgi:TRAP-type C4-dicarboxylate transport system permease small subunit
MYREISSPSGSGPFLVWIDRLNQAIAYLMAGALGVMVICTVLQVLVRFLLTRFGILLSVPWSEELARFLMIWIVFLGSAVACRRGQLIALEFFVESMSERLSYWVRMFALTLCLVFFAMLIWLGWHYTTGNLIERSPVMTIEMMWVYVSLPVSAVLMVVNTACLMFDETVRGHRRVDPGDVVVD